MRVAGLYSSELFDCKQGGEATVISSNGTRPTHRQHTPSPKPLPAPAYRGNRVREAGLHGLYSGTSNSFGKSMRRRGTPPRSPPAKNSSWFRVNILLALAMGMFHGSIFPSAETCGKACSNEPLMSDHVAPKPACAF
jgi:hypothetical protein